MDETDRSSCRSVVVEGRRLSRASSSSPATCVTRGGAHALAQQKRGESQARRTDLSTAGVGSDFSRIEGESGQVISTEWEYQFVQTLQVELRWKINWGPRTGGLSFAVDDPIRNKSEKWRAKDVMALLSGNFHARDLQ